MLKVLTARGGWAVNLIGQTLVAVVREHNSKQIRDDWQWAQSFWKFWHRVPNSLKQQWSPMLAICTRQDEKFI